MKKLLLGILLVSIPFLWFGESRRFFKMTNGSYITLWKTYGNVSFIIPGRYYGVLFPTGNHIETSNLNSITLYKRRGDEDTLFFISRDRTLVNNPNRSEYVLVDLKLLVNSELGAILSQKPKERHLKEWSILNLQIKENYARDESGLIQN